VNCRFCAAELSDVFLDLGSAPPSNAFLSSASLSAPEVYYPLRLLTCADCLLVQVGEVPPRAELFAPDYAYVSSSSRSWLEHAERFASGAIPRLGLGSTSRVMEVASNDGYLLQYFAARGIPCLGIEPTAGTATAARAKGIETLVEFFGLDFARDLARERGKADLIIANNVLAHVPDLNDFVAGLAHALAADGAITLEFPHLMELVSHRQFDTVYHEHYSYFSLHTVVSVLAVHGLRVWDVERLPTHGGSLRLWAGHEASSRAQERTVQDMLGLESRTGMRTRDYYEGFQGEADTAKNALLEFLLQQRREGRSVGGYGAAAKGNTLLNYAGVKPDLLPYVVDVSPHKQGKFLPGSRIPVVAETYLRAHRPDWVLILPWNLKAEITEQLSYIREWGGAFVTAIPRLETT
jgi:SAM-dependent methyltransferase